MEWFLVEILERPYREVCSRVCSKVSGGVDRRDFRRVYGSVYSRAEIGDVQNGSAKVYGGWTRDG